VRPGTRARQPDRVVAVGGADVDDLLVAARDRLLDRRPDLRLVGAEQLRDDQLAAADRELRVAHPGERPALDGQAVLAHELAGDAAHGVAAPADAVQGVEPCGLDARIDAVGEDGGDGHDARG
jgi:hypothetical protein